MIIMFVILIMDISAGFIAIMFWTFVFVTTVCCAPLVKDVDYQASGIYHSAEIDFLRELLSDIREELVELNSIDSNENELDLKQPETNRAGMNKNSPLKEELLNLARHYVEKSLLFSTTGSDIGSLKDAYQLLNRLYDKIIEIDNTETEISEGYGDEVSRLIQKKLELLTNADNTERTDDGEPDNDDDNTDKTDETNDREPDNSHSSQGDTSSLIVDSGLMALVSELIDAISGDKYNRKRSPTHDSNTKEEPIIDIDLDMREKTTQNNKGHVCLTDLYRNKGGICTDVKGYAMSPIYTIATCPLWEMASNIRHLCENTGQYPWETLKQNVIDIVNTPVQGPNGLVYKNMYCAQCNGVKNVEAWSTKLECDFQPSLEISDGNDEFTIMGEVDDEISSETQNCKKQMTPVTPRMIHECDKRDIKDIEYRQHDTRIGNPSRNEVSPFPLSFQILMNFGFDGKTHILFSTTQDESEQSSVCPNGATYDPVNKMCRTVSCNEGYKLVDFNCERIQESDSMTDDITHLTEMEDPAQVVLTIRNISLGEIAILNLDGIEEFLDIQFADMFNISVERIDNLKINLVNLSSSANHSSDNEIEIHRFTTPKPSRHQQAQHSEMKPALETAIEPPSNVGNTVPPTAMTTRSKNRTIPVNVYTAPRVDDPVPLVSTETSSVDRSFNDTATSNQQEATDYSNYSQYLGPVESIYKSETDELFSMYWNISLKISFSLQPPHKNRTLTEKSVKNVVDSMNDLIKTNTFFLVVNGTNFRVQEMENAPNPSSMEDFCKKGKQSYYMDDELVLKRAYDAETGINETHVYVNSTGKIYYPGEYDVTISVDAIVGDLSEMIYSTFAFVCDMPRIINEECVRIVLNKSEYEMLANKSIKFVDSVFNTSEYEYDCEKLDSVRICAPDWSTAQLITNGAKWTLACGEDMIKLVLAESYLSFILGVISLLAMLSVLTTYGLFEKLRNLPGINTINLTLSLFLGELVFIVSGWAQPQEEWHCSGVGMLLHYLFLTSFFWMNVMTFDLYKTFAKKCILRRIRDKEKYMPRYSLYAWGSPMIIVAACAFVDFSGLFGENPVGYGGGNFAASSPSDLQIEQPDNDTLVTSGNHGYSIGCWIQRPVASMVAFGGPMMLILLSNAIMFSRTIASIRASTKATKMKVRRSNSISGQYDVMLYVRMSTVMGFTWILGLASSVVSAFASPTSQITCIVLHTLGILFILFNCSQGLFIFFAFVFNRRVLALYRGLIKKLKTPRHQTLSVSSSRGTLTTNTSQCSLNTVCAKM